MIQTGLKRCSSYYYYHYKTAAAARRRRRRRRLPITTIIRSTPIWIPLESMEAFIHQRMVSLTQQMLPWRWLVLLLWLYYLLLPLSARARAQGAHLLERTAIRRIARDARRAHTAELEDGTLVEFNNIIICAGRLSAIDCSMYYACQVNGLKV